MSEGAQAELDRFFEREGWVSINSRVGTPNELEYQIKIGDEPIRLAVNYLTASTNPVEKIPWPPHLNDDCIKPISGKYPVEFNFSLDQWASINLTSK